jgi:hypothetical protein
MGASRAQIMLEEPGLEIVLGSYFERSSGFSQ